MTFLRNIVVKYLEESLHKIKTGECELTDDEAIDIISVIAHQAVSREEACETINVNNSRFSKLLDEGKIPQGRKRKGWRELRWYRDELIKSIYHNKKKNINNP